MPRCKHYASIAITAQDLTQKTSINLMIKAKHQHIAFSRMERNNMRAIEEKRKLTQEELKEVIARNKFRAMYQKNIIKGKHNKKFTKKDFEVIAITAFSKDHHIVTCKVGSGTRKKVWIRRYILPIGTTYHRHMHKYHFGTGHEAGGRRIKRRSKMPYNWVAYGGPNLLNNISRGEEE